MVKVVSSVVVVGVGFIGLEFVVVVVELGVSVYVLEFGDWLMVCVVLMEMF